MNWFGTDGAGNMVGTGAYIGYIKIDDGQKVITKNLKIGVANRAMTKRGGGGPSPSRLNRHENTFGNQEVKRDAKVKVIARSRCRDRGQSVCRHPAFCADSHAAPFLRMGVGARALGMGGAFTAVADDATASYWNPAGLTKIENIEATFMYAANMSVDRQLNYFGYAQWLGVGGLGRVLDQCRHDGHARTGRRRQLHWLPRTPATTRSGSPTVWKWAA